MKKLKYLKDLDEIEELRRSRDITAFESIIELLAILDKACLNNPQRKMVIEARAKILVDDLKIPDNMVQEEV